MVATVPLRRTRRRIAAIAGALIASSLAIVPAAASDRMLESVSPITAVVLDGAAGDPFTGGHAWTWVAPGDTITVGAGSTNTHIRIDFPGGWVDLAPPNGQTLINGAYEGATRYPFQDPSVPGLDVYNAGVACTTVTGRFVISEATYGVDGKPTHLAVAFEQHCDGAVPATYGEIRIDSTVGLAAAGLSPLGDADLFFGYQVIGGPGLTKTYTLTSVGNIDLTVGTITKTNIFGTDTFSIESQTCAGATLSPGQSCTIDIHYAPTTDDGSNADFRITDSGTRTYRVISVRGIGTVGAATNDAISDATSIGSLPYSTLENTSAATPDASDPQCFGSSGSVWFAFTPAASQAYTATTLGSYYPTALCVFSGDPGSLVSIGANDDDPAGGQTSRLDFAATAGTTYYLMVGANAGSGGDRLAFALRVGPPDKTVSATGVGVNYGTFYPYHDGYRDTVTIRGKLAERATVSISIYGPTGGRVRAFALGSQFGSYGQAWDGRNSAGTRLAAGKYKVVQRLVDVLGNVLVSTSYTNISNKRLTTVTRSITKYGAQFAYYGDPGNGYVSTSRSSYYRGVRLSSGTSWAATGYTFALPSAISYKTVWFKVLGRSLGSRKAYIAIWNPSLGSYLDLAAYDATQRAGTAYGWYSTHTSLATHQKSSRARAVLLVVYEGGAATFDAARVRLTISYVVLQ